MSDTEQASGQEPKYGHWTEEQLRSYIRLMAEGKDLRGSTRQSRLAMVISQHTGCHYPWAWREIERIAGGPRWDGCESDRVADWPTHCRHGRPIASGQSGNCEECAKADLGRAASLQEVRALRTRECTCSCHGNARIHGACEECDDRHGRSTPSGTPPETVQLSREEWAQAVEAMAGVLSWRAAMPGKARHVVNGVELPFRQVTDGPETVAMLAQVRAALSALRAAGERGK